MATLNFLRWRPHPPRHLCRITLPPPSKGGTPDFFSSKWPQRVYFRLPRWLRLPRSLSFCFWSDREKSRGGGNLLQLQSYSCIWFTVTSYSCIQLQLVHATVAMHQCSIGFVLWSVWLWFKTWKAWNGRPDNGGLCRITLSANNYWF